MAHTPKVARLAAIKRGAARLRAARAYLDGVDVRQTAGLGVSQNSHWPISAIFDFRFSTRFLIFV